MICSRPGTDTYITPENREPIKAWLVTRGIAADRVSGMKDATLFKAYSKPAYLQAILWRGDYKNPKQPSEPVERNPVPVEPTPEPAAEGEGWREGWKQPVEPTPEPSKPASNGHDDNEELARLIQRLAMRGQHVNEQRVIDLIREHAPKPDERVIERLVILRNEEKRELPDAPRHHMFATILQAVSANIPVMLVGPAGAGKTTMCHQISEATELAFYHTGAVTSRYELSGYNDAHGNYQGTSFREAYENGGLFLFDEVDGSDPAALLWCNTAIANGVCAFPDKIVPRHANFRLIAAANTFGKGADRVYVGRNALDGASLDRFIMFAFDYDETMERRIFGDNDWTKRVHQVRKAIESLKLRHVVSQRAIDYGRRLLEAGMPQHAVESAVLWKGLEPDQSAKIENAIR
jgi:cobaltochelatase CobS